MTFRLIALPLCSGLLILAAMTDGTQAGEKHKGEIDVLAWSSGTKKNPNDNKTTKSNTSDRMGGGGGGKGSVQQGGTGGGVGKVSAQDLTVRKAGGTSVEYLNGAGKPKALRDADPPRGGGRDNDRPRGGQGLDLPGRR